MKLVAATGNAHSARVFEKAAAEGGSGQIEAISSRTAVNGGVSRAPRSTTGTARPAYQAALERGGPYRFA